MSTAKKALLFLSGVMVGLAAGAGYFFYSNSSSNTERKMVNNSLDTVKQSASMTLLSPLNRPSLNLAKDSVNSASLLAEKYKNEIPSKQILAEADSLLRKQSISTEENIIVKTDRLIASLKKDINTLSTDPLPSVDTTLESLSGIKESKLTPSSIEVEFWQSPINFRGYKMSRNKIVMYGIDPNQNIDLYFLDNSLYFKDNTTAFQLTYTDVFKQLEKTNNPAILTKLSQ